MEGITGYAAVLHAPSSGVQNVAWRKMLACVLSCPFDYSAIVYGIAINHIALLRLDAHPISCTCTHSLFSLRYSNSDRKERRGYLVSPAASSTAIGPTLQGSCVDG